MKTSLENVSKRFYAFLDERDVRVEQERTSNSFGNFVVDARTPEFRMRFIRDRGNIFIQVGRKGDTDWHGLDHVLELMTNTPVSNDPEVLTEYLLNDYGSICATLNSGDFPEAIAQRKTKRGESL